MPTQSIVKQPRGIVYLNDTIVNVIKIEVNSTTNFLADTFSMELPLTGQPKGIDSAFFSSVPAIMASIYAGYPKNVELYTKNDLTNLITGQVDDIELNYLANTVILTGRDLTAKFIDNKTTQKYPNLTSSEIVTMLAKKEGLTPDVTETTTKAGVFYANNHATLASETPEWDLITFLAQNEGFVAHVEGTTLYFHPEPKITDKPYLLQYNKNDSGAPSFIGMSLEMKRTLTVARDVIVTVKSWNSHAKKAFKVTVKATPNKKVALASKAQPIGDAQTYVYTKPGLTREQALNFAQQKIRELTKHERNIEVEMPADHALKKVSVIKLAGTETDFDQVYFTSSINRVLSTKEGFRMTINAKNHSPNSKVTL